MPVNSLAPCSGAPSEREVGTILAFDPPTGRYHVQLADGAVRAIRPPHVVARSFASQDEEYGKWTAPAPER
eukprot:s319_g6.t1